MSYLKAFFIAALLLAPLIWTLAPSPQSPDGAEMVWTAVHGGVLHPSGMPLQAWVNRFVASAHPESAAWLLSWVSWVGAVAAAAFLFLTLQKIGAGPFESALAVAAYGYIPIVALMSVVPEKYSWLSFTQVMFLYALVCFIAERSVTSWAAAALGAVLGFALAQHSANVILVPAFLYVLARPFFFSGPKGAPIRASLISLLTAVVVTGAFYASLFFLTAEAPWPDWGKIDSWAGIAAHALRKDYDYIRLFDAEASGAGDRLAAFRLLAKGLVSLNGAFLFVFLGFFALLRTQSGRFLWALILLILLPGLAVLSLTAMPSADLDTALGYQERYPLLVWPILILYWGVGLSWCMKRWPRYANWMRGAVAIALVLFSVQGVQSSAYAQNSWTDLYREQARFELEDYNIFWSGSDFVAFLGVPTASGVLFPVKNLIGLSWYRERALPALSPAVARVLKERQPGNVPELFRNLIAEGFKIVATEPTQVLTQNDLMAQAEQTGVLWTFSAANSALYTKRIVANTLHLCTLLERADRGLPPEGLYFVREIVNYFRYAFLSAGDYLQAQMELGPASAARSVAEALQPGRLPAEWRSACGQYAQSMSTQ